MTRRKDVHPDFDSAQLFAGMREVVIHASDLADIE